MSGKLSKATVDSLKVDATPATNLERTLANRDWIIELREIVESLKAEVKSLKAARVVERLTNVEDVARDLNAGIERLKSSRPKMGPGWGLGGK